MGRAKEWNSMVRRTKSRQSVDTHERQTETDAEGLADLMADPHCRYLLKYLKENENPVSVSVLTRYVVAEITGTPIDDVSDAVQRRVQTWLHHGQLSALDERGVLEFDPESGMVSLTSDPLR